MLEKFDKAAEKVSPRDAQKGGQGALSAEHPETALKQNAATSGQPTPPTHETTQGLSSGQIALLCEVEGQDSTKVTDDKERDLGRLRAEGYIARDENKAGAHFKLTAKGLEFLGKRGAGINEA